MLSIDQVTMKPVQKKFLSQTICFVVMLIGLTVTNLFAQALKSNDKKPTPKSIETNGVTQEPLTNNIALTSNEIDRIIAVVNREVITVKDLKERTILVKKQLLEAKRPLPTDDILIKQVLERLIEESVIFQEANLVNFKVNELEIDSILGNIASQKNMSPAEYKASFDKSDVSYEKFRNNLKRDVLITRYRERIVDSRVKITDAEINDFIVARLPNNSSKTSTGQTATSTPETLYIIQILVPVKDSDNKGEQLAARQKADEIYLKAKSANEYIPFVNQLIQVDKKVQVQDLGYRTIDRLPQIFIDATKNLKPGQLASEVLKSPAGYHIVKLLDRKGGASASSSVVPAETNLGQSVKLEQSEILHLMIAKKPGVSEEDSLRKLRNYKSQVESNTAKFGDLAKKFSEDKESAPNNGYVGWVSPGQTLPEFDVAIKNLSAGQVTEPFSTEFGWHLLQVVNKQVKEITFSQQKEFARNALRQEKLEQAYQDWIREIRDSATVDYRPPFVIEK